MKIEETGNAGLDAELIAAAAAVIEAASKFGAANDAAEAATKSDPVRREELRQAAGAASLDLSAAAFRLAAMPAATPAGAVARARALVSLWGGSSAPGAGEWVYPDEALVRALVGDVLRMPAGEPAAIRSAA